MLLFRLWRYLSEGTAIVSTVVASRCGAARPGGVAAHLGSFVTAAQVLHPVELLVATLVEGVADPLGLVPGGVPADPVPVALIVLADH
jgi:hypothetical protein